MPVESKLENHILTLTLNFNEQNVVDKPGLEALDAALTEWHDHPDVRVMIIQSAHEKFFCNGLSPEWFLDKSEDEIRQSWAYVSSIMSKLFMFPRPTVAKITGHCMALGAVWGLACDYRAMGDGPGRYAFSEAMISMNMPSIAVQMLQDIVGNHRMRTLLYTGRGMKAKEALNAGLVDFLIEDGQSKELDKLITSLSKLTLESARGMKVAINRRLVNYAEQNDAWDLDELVNTTFSANAQEGFRSLSEGRRPKFS